MQGVFKIANCNYTYVNPDTLYTIPAGEYAVCIVPIKENTADFSPLLSWITERRYTAVSVYAEELGLQLFDYIDDYCCEIKIQLSRE